MEKSEIEEKTKNVVKVVMIGDENTGKSFLFNHYMHSIPTLDYKPTQGSDFASKSIQLDNQKIILQVWDLSGNPEFRNNIPDYLKGIHGIIICYSCTNRKSFEFAEDCSKLVQKHANKETAKILVSTKCDCQEERQVGHGEGESSAKSMGMKLFETSTNNELSIDDMFLGLVKLIKEKRDCDKEFGRIRMNNNTMNLNNNNTANNTNVNSNIRPVVRLINRDYDYLMKLLLVGDASVGKTSLSNRYIQDVFQDPFFTTIGVDFMMKRLEINNRAVKLQIWDTAGAERFRAITSAYYRGAHGILLCYAINNKNSFDNVDRWMEQIVRSINDSCCIILLGTKSDLETVRQVSVEEGKGLADRYGVQFF